MKLLVNPPTPWPNWQVPVSTRKLADYHGARGGGFTVARGGETDAEGTPPVLVWVLASPFASAEGSMDETAGLAPSRSFKLDSKWAFFFRELNPASEIASQNNQNKA